jgi:hypothetical protein
MANHQRRRLQSSKRMKGTKILEKNKERRERQMWQTKQTANV